MKTCSKCGAQKTVYNSIYTVDICDECKEGMATPMTGTPAAGVWRTDMENAPKSRYEGYQPEYFLGIMEGFEPILCFRDLDGSTRSSGGWPIDLVQWAEIFLPERDTK